MSEENVEVVRRVYEASARRDSATVLALYDPEVEIDVTRGAVRSLAELSIVGTKGFGPSSVGGMRHGRASRPTSGS